MGDNPLNVFSDILGSRYTAPEVSAGAKRAQEGAQPRRNGTAYDPRGPVRGPSKNPEVMAAVEAAKRRSEKNLKKRK